MGPLGELGGVEEALSVGRAVSSPPPLRKSHPRLFHLIIITIVGREVTHIEGVTHGVLGLGYVDDVGVVIDSLEDLVRSITTRL